MSGLSRLAARTNRVPWKGKDSSDHARRSVQVHSISSQDLRVVSLPPAMGHEHMLRASTKDATPSPQASRASVRGASDSVWGYLVWLVPTHS